MDETYSGSTVRIFRNGEPEDIPAEVFLEMLEQIRGGKPEATVSKTTKELP